MKFTVKNKTSSIVESVEASSHLDAVKKACIQANVSCTDSRYTWISTCHDSQPRKNRIAL
jgi:hypothetical protein